MSLYVDTSALLKRYVEEPESAQCEDLLLADPEWITARLTWIEVRRNLCRLLAGKSLAAALQDFGKDWDRTYVVELDEVTCSLASEIAESTGARTLDALHLAAASRTGASTTAVLTYDIRQAQTARSLGLMVKGL